MKLQKFFFFLLLFLCLLFRFFSLNSLALLDPSEGRYASIAQSMHLSGDWITPYTFQNGAQVPFLGKPPLHTWFTALSFRLFGMTEFAARLPSFLAVVGTLLLIVGFSARFFSRDIALTASFLFLSMTLVFIGGGTCFTDPLLTFCCAAGVVSFAFFTETQTRRWGLLFFLSCGLGALTKGPVMPVLTAGTVLSWLLVTREWEIIKKLPWKLGVALFLLITIPWYLLAEIKNPGFLKYFIWNENILRFLKKDYGDLYGSGHRHFYGYIWIVLLLAAFPWSLVFLGMFRKGFILRPKETLAMFKRLHPQVKLCIFWAFIPAVFFTFAKQVSFAYIMPGLPGLAVLLSSILHQVSLSDRQRTIIVKVLQWGGGVLAALVLLSGVGGLYWGMTVEQGILFLSGAAILLALVSYLLRQPLPSSELLVQSSRVFAAVIVITLSSLTLSLSDPINEAMSSREMVEYVEHTVKPEGNSVAFLSKIPQSAYFYAREDNGKKLDLELVQTDTQSGEKREEPSLPVKQYIIAEKKEIRKARKRDPELLSQKASHTIANWSLFGS